jgi:tetratricopeptide (TPR) repeat protein
LRAIRQQLAELDLDWDLLPYEPAKEPTPAMAVRAKIDLGSAFELLPARTNVALQSLVLALNSFNFEAYLRRGRAYGFLGDSHRNIADYSMALALMPSGHPFQGEALFRRSNNYRRLHNLSAAHADLQRIAELDLDLPLELQLYGADYCNDLAKDYLTGPEKQRDPKKALALARKAIKLTPDLGLWWTTLGSAYYRLGRYPEAIETLQRSLREARGENAGVNLFLLAMCHAREGEAAKATEYYERAVNWVRDYQSELQPGSKKELDAFRTEAEALLRSPARP